MFLPAASGVRVASTLLTLLILCSGTRAIAADTSPASQTPPVGDATDSYEDDADDVALGRDGKPLTPQLLALGAKVRKTLATYERKHLNARDHSCWEVMHSLIAFGPRTEIFRDGPGGATVNAMGWLCWSGRCQGQPLVILENDRPHALYGVGLQGHDGQYLAMLSQWRVRPTSAMKIGGKDLTVADFIEEEKLTCQSGTELTFKLIALAHYLPSDAKWTSRYGEQWDIPKLLKAEIEAHVHGAACGGTHRLFGISNAVKIRAKRDEPIDGQYARAKKYISDYHRYTLNTLQNRDGSFSTEWFNYAADRIGDSDRKVQTTGHILEWLAWSLPEEQLRDPKVIKSVDFLSNLLLSNPERAWSIGPLGHALHALMIYHERMFTESPLPVVPLTAAHPLRTAPRNVGSLLDPPEPECEHCQELTIAELQRRATRPEGAPATKAADAKASAAKTDTAQQSADPSDGCVDAIPSPAPRPPLKTAMRDAPPAPVPPPAVPASSD